MTTKAEWKRRAKDAEREERYWFRRWEDEAMTPRGPQPYMFGRWRIAGFEFPDDGRDVMDLPLEIPLRPGMARAMGEAFDGLADEGFDVWVALYALPKPPDPDPDPLTAPDPQHPAYKALHRDAEVEG